MDQTELTEALTYRQSGPGDRGSIDDKRSLQNNEAEGMMVGIVRYEDRSSRPNAFITQ